MKLELLKIYYISGMFWLHASTVVIRYVTHFPSALALGDDGASLEIPRTENTFVSHSEYLLQKCPKSQSAFGVGS